MISHTMSSQLELFLSEDRWPFSLRRTELDRCLDFLIDTKKHKARIVRIFGQSGVGKSFFVRELLVRIAERNRKSIVLYLDIPASDLEAAGIFQQINDFITLRRQPSRKTPRQVPKSIAKDWQGRGALLSNPFMQYLYRVTRDLLSTIPAYGDTLKTVLPESLPQRGNRSDPAGAFKFLMKLSHSTSVIIALDNVQFLPATMRHQLDVALQDSGPQLKFIAVERVNTEPRHDWLPAVEDADQYEVFFPPATEGDIRMIVQSTFPQSTNVEELSKAVFRQSEGNLKSAWYQLKLITERKLETQSGQSRQSYEVVISSLKPIDQLVLRTVVVLLGGLTISMLIELFQSTQLRLAGESVSSALSDLTALGLLFINGEHANKVKVEHEIVSKMVNNLTPEGEKLELISCIIDAICELIKRNPINEEINVIYDRLVGIIDQNIVRFRPTLLRHLVDFLRRLNSEENFTYICGLAEDSVYINILDILPEDCVQIILNSLQKCSEFTLGYILTERLNKLGRHAEISDLYAAKYLVQQFRYDDARRFLEKATLSRESIAINFNILINLCENEEARKIAISISNDMKNKAKVTEFDLVILRNSGHLFDEKIARMIVGQSLLEFKKLGSRFGEATALNNLAIVEISAGHLAEARTCLNNARRILSELKSSEIYQPLVNLGGVALLDGDVLLARKHLQEARLSMPRLLSMDAIMLDFNELIVEFHSGVELNADMMEKIYKIHARSVKTMDYRFIDLVSWFTSTVATRLEGQSRIDFSDSRIRRIRNGSQAAMEIILTIQISGAPVDAPYILSPHWRY